MKGNGEEERMEDPKVKTTLTTEFHMKDKLLEDNYISKELVLRNETDYEV